MGVTTITEGTVAVGDLLSAYNPSPEPVHDEPVQPERVQPPEVLIKEARRRQRKRWGFIAVVLGLVGGLVAGVTVSSGAPPPPRKPIVHKGHAPDVPSVALPSLPWAVHLVASTIDVRSVVATTNDLYWLTGPAPSACNAASTTVPVRYDPSTGVKVRGAPLAGCAQAMAVASGSVWALERTGASLVVASLGTQTLAVMKTETFPVTTADPECALEECAALAGGPGPVLWLSNGGEIWRLDSASGAELGSFAPFGMAAALAPGPTGAVLYTSGANPTGGGAAIDEYSVPTGKLTGRAIFTQCLQTGPAQLAAGPSGVWVSCRSGMAGSASALSSDGLAVVPRGVTPTGSNGPFFHMMGVTIATSGGPLWLSSIGDLACANAGTGTLLAKESLPVTTTFGSHAAVAGRLYAEMTNTGVVAVDAPGACFE